MMLAAETGEEGATMLREGTSAADAVILHNEISAAIGNGKCAAATVATCRAPSVAAHRLQIVRVPQQHSGRIRRLASRNVPLQAVAAEAGAGEEDKAPGPR